MKIVSTSVKQEANKVLGTEEKTLYYLIIENSKGARVNINVGKKTHDEVMALNEEEMGVKKLPL